MKMCRSTCLWFDISSFLYWRSSHLRIQRSLSASFSRLYKILSFAQVFFFFFVFTLPLIWLTLIVWISNFSNSFYYSGHIFFITYFSRFVKSNWRRHQFSDAPFRIDVSNDDQPGGRIRQILSPYISLLYYILFVLNLYNFSLF